MERLEASNRLAERPHTAPQSLDDIKLRSCLKYVCMQTNVACHEDSAPWHYFLEHCQSAPAQVLLEHMPLPLHLALFPHQTAVAKKVRHRMSRQQYAAACAHALETSAAARPYLGIREAPVFFPNPDSSRPASPSFTYIPAPSSGCSRQLRRMSGMGLLFSTILTTSLHYPHHLEPSALLRAGTTAAHHRCSRTCLQLAH